MPGEDDSGGARLGWKDYVALFIAFIQTIALPMIILILVLVAILLLAAAFR